MIIDYFVNNFGAIGVVMVIGIIGFGTYLVIGRGKDKHDAIQDFDNKIKLFNRDFKVGRELRNPPDGYDGGDYVDFRTDNTVDDSWPPMGH